MMTGNQQSFVAQQEQSRPAICHQHRRGSSCNLRMNAESTTTKTLRRARFVLAFVPILLICAQIARPATSLQHESGGAPSSATLNSSSSNNPQPRQQVSGDQPLRRPQHQVPTSHQANAPFSTASAGGSGAKPNERFNLIEADENGLYLLGLFDIHQSNPRVPFKCGQIDLDAGEWQSHRPMQNMEAFLWAIAQVNADQSILPGIRLGSLVMDTCSSFLRTNQQLANLLHQPQPQQQQQQQLPSVRQILGIVADNSDPHSVEAVVGMASSLGLTTFVTQSRSTKLSELASKYNTNSKQAATSPSQYQEPSGREAGVAAAAHPFESILGDLLGIDKMMPATPLSPASSPDIDNNQQQQQQERRALNSSSSAIGLARDTGTQDGGESAANLNRDSSIQQQREKLLMVRMLLGNELLAEALATLLQQMGWDFVSLIYDDEPDMVDLHDELTRQMFSRATQLALDEQVSFSSSTPSELVFDRLLQNLAKKSQFGAKVVIALLGTGSARLLLDSLNHLRSSSSYSATPRQLELTKRVNSLLWITVSDREPYYSFATDALGTISVSSSVSLLPKFKSHYDHLINDECRSPAHSSFGDPHSKGSSPPSSVTAGSNKWWPEYMRAILTKHHKEIELLSNECARWLEPRSSLLNEKCRSLTLSSLVQVEKLSSPAPSSSQQQQRRASQPNKSKLAKYLAAGWEHNGMDVIDSVAAIANGLEYIRQALCPESVAGVCERMREFIAASPAPPQTAASTSQVSSSSSQRQRQQQPMEQAPKPTLSELVYEELLRSTFQQADGRLFNMDEFSSLGGQVEGKLKLYNLRYLQPNSIGFVRFGQFEQQDGLVLNASKARHYPGGASYKDQVGIEQVKSSCQDERKCLMMSAIELASMNKQIISEEEAALGVNSLFKLDHPLMVLGSSAGFPPQPSAASGNPEGYPASLRASTFTAGQASQQQQQLASESLDNWSTAQQTGVGGGGVSKLQQQAIVRQVSEDSHIRTMRPAKQTSSAFYHNWPQSGLATLSAAAAVRAAPNTNGSTGNSKLTFNAIVLLPLHRRRRRSRQQAAAANTGEYQSSAPACSPQLDMERSFQHLVALAYALNTAEASASATAKAAPNQPRRQQQVELTTTVIDYCEQVELAENKLALKLTSSEILQQELPVAIIDFDTKLSEHIDKLVGRNRNLLHLTIGTPKGFQSSQHLQHNNNKWQHHDGDANHDASSSTHNDAGVASGRSISSGSSSEQHLRVSLLPSKANEIQALVSLLGSSSVGRDWRLVHLIYTDHHHYRDEFVRRANEANVCVSKLIWIPTLDEDDEGGGADFGQEEQEMVRQDRLDKTKRLFERELYDYSSPSSSEGTSNSKAEGLNSTRILVVLASANDATNRLILAAASKSMLEDYVWITTHEWLVSVELAAERQAPSYFDQFSSSTSERTNDRQSSPGGSGAPSKDSSPPDFSNPPRTTGREQVDVEAGKLPRLFVSTRIESYLSGDSYRRYFSSLTPAVHSPLPTSWFDEYWQQKFNCRLPISNPSLVHQDQQQLPVCKSNQHLDLHSLLQIEDDRVSYVIQAIESMYSALRAQNLSKCSDFSAKNFGAKFKQVFKQKQQSQQQQFSKGKLQDYGFSKLPYGFHIVHRLVPTEFQQPQQSDIAAGNLSSRRRQNSRDLSPSQPGQLVKVGVWRDGELIILRKQNDTIFSWLNSPVPKSRDLEPVAEVASVNINDQVEDDDTGARVAKSLNRLFSVKSRCRPQSETCNLCRQQIEQTKNQLKREEARLKQSESVSEPKAISSIDLSNGNHGRANLAGKRERQLAGGGTILDSVPDSPFEEGEDDGDETAGSNDDGAKSNSNEDASSNSRGNSIEQPRRHHQQQQQDVANGTTAGQALDEIQASASSLFDAATSQQVEQQRLADSARAHRAMMMSSSSQAARQSSCSVRTANGGSRRNFIMSLLSVLGIIGTMLAMICLYPSMEANLLRRQQLGKLHDEDKFSTVGSQSSLVARQPTPSSSSIARRREAAVAVTLADYFLLAGLLMLNSINIAFLLPATMSVCWFRRVGLASSYTVMLSSILVKVIGNYRRRHHHQSSSSGAKRADSPTAHQSSAAAGASTSGQQLWQQSDLLDPLEETIEVTFESLPHNCNEQPSSIVSNTESHSQRSTAGNESNFGSNDVFTMSSSSEQQHHLSNGYQTSTVPATTTTTPSSFSTTTATISQQSDHYLHHHLCAKQTSGGRASSMDGDSMGLSVCLALVLGQVLVSIVWLGQQPPEPTLLSGCWYCSSPLRAPLNFHLEPLLALLYPALLLALSLPLGLASLRRASRYERQYRHALEKLQLNRHDNHFGAHRQQTTAQTRTQAHSKLSQLAARVREAKSLVMTITLLALIWAALTLTTISASRTNLSSISEFYSIQPARGEEQTTPKTIPPENKTLALDEQTLVEANLVSGAIIFTFLFIYRLSLLASLGNACYSCCCCCCNFWPSTKQAKAERRSQRQRKPAQLGANQNQSVLTLNRQSPTATRQAGNKWLDFGSDDLSHSADYFQDSSSNSSFASGLFGARSNINSAGANQSERLGLQQFSSYGTYSNSAALTGFERNSAGSCHQFNTMNPLQAIVSSFGVGETTTAGSAAAPVETSSTGASRAPASTTKNEGKLRKNDAPKRRKSSLFGSLASSPSPTNGFGRNTNNDSARRSDKRAPVPKPRSINTLRSVVAASHLGGSQAGASGDSKLQRRQSTGSVASSTAQLVGGGDRNLSASMVDVDDLYALDDTVSVASSSNSQLQGNDLYPIDCSLQLDSCEVFGQVEQEEDALTQHPQQANSTSRHSQQQQVAFGARPGGSFGRQSLRRSFAKSGNKLSSVKEEQAQS